MGVQSAAEKVICSQRRTMLEGLGRPLRFICEGGRKPEGFGMPVAPVVTWVSFEESACMSKVCWGFC